MWGGNFSDDCAMALQAVLWIIGAKQFFPPHK